MTEKNRLDAELVNRGLATGRDRAKAIIMTGIVYVNNQKADKPGQQVSAQDNIEVRGETQKYVSRGGLKLEKAMDCFGLKLEGFLCADIGASTGGFTDCMLCRGASKVYAVDVGYGQLAWKLRCDPRVINLERTNVRDVTDSHIPEKLDFASVDVAFISLKLVFPALYRILKDDAKAVCLVKPQFEAGREFVGKKGVVRDMNVHISVAEAVTQSAREMGFTPLALTFSPIRGPEGNIEYLLLLQKGTNAQDAVTPELIRQTVEASHMSL